MTFKNKAQVGYMKNLIIIKCSLFCILNVNYIVLGADTSDFSTYEIEIFSSVYNTVDTVLPLCIPRYHNKNHKQNCSQCFKF